MTARRNLVFSSVGHRSQHRQWIGGPDASFDLCLYRYEGAADYSKDAEIYHVRPGTKLQNFCHFYFTHPDLLDRYRNVFIVDDDILMEAAAIDRMFAIFEAEGLWFAQPAFDEESHARHLITRREKSAFLRHTNFVEIGVLLAQRAAIDRVIHVMAQSASGWGVDMLLSQLTGDPVDRIAILDTVTCRHPHRRERAMDNVMSREEMKAEGAALLAKYRRGEMLRPVVHRTVLLGER